MGKIIMFITTVIILYFVVFSFNSYNQQAPGPEIDGEEVEQVVV